jgi:hypothetical protein
MDPCRTAGIDLRSGIGVPQRRGRVGFQIAEEVQADYSPWRTHRA